MYSKIQAYSLLSK